jgi:hypothetical protein
LLGPICALDGDTSDCPDGPSLGGSVRAGDITGEGNLPDLTDAIAYLELAFLGVTAGGLTELPCGDGGFEHPANVAAFNVNLDTVVDFSDSIYLLGWLFIGGPPPVQGLECLSIPGCLSTCVE